MNWYTKMVMGRDGVKQVEFIQSFFIKPASGSISLNEVKYNNDENVQINF